MLEIRRSGKDSVTFSTTSSKVLAIPTTLNALASKANLISRAIIPSSSANDVLIVFFSQHPDKHIGQVVVGWYKKSIVTRDWKKEKMNGISRWYWTKAKTKDSVLLPTYNRVLKIPRGKNTPGQSNTFFIHDNDGKLKRLKWLSKILSYINNYDGPNLIENPVSEAFKKIEVKLLEELETSAAQGRILNQAARKVIENKAMNAAMKYYKSKGYNVENVSSKKCYDLECRNSSNKKFVEVKGSILPVGKIILTFNEVEFARKNKGKMNLFLCTP